MKVSYINTSYKPQKTDLIATFYVEPAKGISFRGAAEKVAAESSVGTWTTLTTIPKRIEKIKARVFRLNPKNKTIKIAYPIELFEPNSAPQILSSVAGNIFGMKAVKNLRLVDIEFPEKIVRKFKGPQFGIKRIRKIMKIKDRPLLASVPKPKVGYSTSEYGKVAYQIWSGGLDFVKDDENLTNQSFNKFEKRLALLMKIRDKVEKETGERKSYFANITSETEEMKRRAKLVADYGNEYVMIDIVTAGFAALQTMRNYLDDLHLAIHAHRAMHAVFTRNRKHGISMLVLAKLARLIGVDNLHVGTVVGKLVSPKEEVYQLKEFLRSEWYGKKKTFPVSSGGLHPGLLPFIVKFFGNDLVMQIGGGVHGHPRGTYYGAKACREVLEAIQQGISLKQYAKTHEALRLALEKWGFARPR
ncbi:MAG: type III ribulose-bisphosphate carboxylase [Candidatus Aenigmarchaeota archaeon]|nr:type III ribulose-bisphosphate carboxylase [Candidatus Aenigmarchaeota archaeon]